jgi:hypothetical protein
MALPYSSATSGKAAMGEVQRILQGFGASSFGHMEDFHTGTLTVQFVWKERRVTIEANAKGYAAALLREKPYTSRMRGSKADYETKCLKQGQIAVYSILRDWIKGQVTAVEVGMLSFEGAFLGQIMLPNGGTILQLVERENLLALPSR